MSNKRAKKRRTQPTDSIEGEIVKVQAEEFKTKDNPNRKKRGRPRVFINYELAGSLAEIHCTQEEIAKAMRVSINKLEKDKEFIRVYKEGLLEGKKSLRRRMFEVAMDKENVNNTMLIWLSKQLLGMKDMAKIESKHTETIQGDIQVTEKIEVNLKAMSKEELIELNRLLSKSISGSTTQSQQGTDGKELERVH